MDRRKSTGARGRAVGLVVALGVAVAACVVAGGPDRPTGDTAPPSTSGPSRTTTPPAPARVANVACGLGSFGAGRWPSACWRPYGDASPFNRRLPADPPVLPDSRAIVEQMLDSGPVAGLVVASDTRSDWYHPVTFPAPDDPLYTVHCLEDWGTCEVEGMQVRLPRAARPAAGGDGHLAVVDQATGWEYDFWQVRPRSPGGGTLSVSWGGRTEITGDGLGSDATAAHFGLLAGVIRAAELKAGRIDHALFMTVGCTAHSYVYPAAGYALDCEDGAPAPAVGQLFRLAMTADEIAALDLPAWQETILRALARYGAYVGDTGGNEAFGFQLESGTTYTAFGVDDPFVAFAQAQDAGVTARGERYEFEVGAGVDWRNRLEALHPCVAQMTC